MNTYIKTLLVCLVLTWIACDRNEPGENVPTKEETARDIFYKIPGLYQVSDSTGNYAYNMRVSYFPDTLRENGVVIERRDCVGLFNFDNQFDTLYFKYSALGLSAINKRPSMVINYYIENAVKRDGSRWKVIDEYPDNLEEGDKRGWYNGEMWISFRLINVNYYMEDGVPFGDTIKFQKAIRIGD